MLESKNLKNTAKKGLFWSAIDRFGAQGIQFVFGILITRILFPEDYGLVGMVYIFMMVGQTLLDSGFGTALIWKRNTTDEDYSTVFYFNVIASFFLYAVIFLLAPVISNFYNEPRLVLLIRVLCLNFIIIAFSIIQQVILQKTVNFKNLAYINIIATLSSGAISLYMAHAGYGVWAVVFQILIKSFVLTILLWVFYKWRPLLVFSFKSLKELFAYGSKISISGLINTVFQYIYFNVIGKIFSVVSLGYYTRAVQLQEFPVKTIGSVFQRVVFPVFASVQDENERLTNMIRKTIRTMVFVTFPVLFGLIATADELIEIVLTEKWLIAASYFKLLCVVGLFFTFQVLNVEILKTKGKSGLVLKLEVITKIVLVVNIFITYRWGITAIIFGQLATVLFTYLLGGFYVWKTVGYSVWDQMKDIFKYMLASVLMNVLLMLISPLISSLLIKLVLKVVVGSVFYFLFAWLTKMDEVDEVRMSINKLIAKRKNS